MSDPPAPTVRLYDTGGSMDKQGLILGAMHAPLQAAHRSRRRAFRSAPTSICVRAPAATAAVWHITPRLRIYGCSPGKDTT